MRTRLLALAALAAVQLAVPVGSLVTQERTLREGAVWRLRTGPVDPYDAFRGRYVALSYPMARDVPLPVGAVQGDRLWAPLVPDEQGFATFGPLTTTRPSGDALQVTVTWADDRGHGAVEVPFAVYWMPEDLAPEADRLYAEARRGPDPQTWVTIRVRGDHAALEELWIDGEPVRDRIARD